MKRKGLEGVPTTRPSGEKVTHNHTITTEPSCGIILILQAPKIQPPMPTMVFRQLRIPQVAFAQLGAPELGVVEVTITSQMKTVIDQID